MSTPSSTPPTFLTDVLGPAHPGPRLNPDNPTRPYVTLTFAQSLDGKIAGKDGKQLILSGRESMIMTHWCAGIILVCNHMLIPQGTQDEDNA
jgi:2,5-diamino-6-(ribosylamino)-4(3H)-pyrimidinone 5'-phosphate reductase